MRRIFTNGEARRGNLCLTTPSISKPTLSLWFLLSESWSRSPYGLPHDSRLDRLITSPHRSSTSIIKRHRTQNINQNSHITILKFIVLETTSSQQQSQAKTNARPVGSLDYWFRCLFTILTVYAGMPNEPY